MEEEEEEEEMGQAKWSWKLCVKIDEAMGLILTDNHGIFGKVFVEAFWAGAIEIEVERIGRREESEEKGNRA